MTPKEIFEEIRYCDSGPRRAATILSPGPSLVKLARDNHGYDLPVPRIAVNRAPLLTGHAIHVWSVGDDRLYDGIAWNVRTRQAEGIPLKYLLSPELLSLLRSRGHGGDGWIDSGTFAEMASAANTPLPDHWDFTAGTKALAFCCLAGVNNLLTAGVDFSGTADADGSEGFKLANGTIENFGNRTPERWAVEKAIWNEMIQRFDIQWSRV